MKLLSARHSVRSTFHSAAAAEMSISRAAAPALRRLAYEVRVLRLPPVSCSPYFASRSACTTFTLFQSQESSSATIIGKLVRTPWPISDLPHQIFISPVGEISSQALGANAWFGKEPCCARAGRGRWKARRRLPPVAAE